ncbi:MAG: RNA polymerase sigma factor [Acidimicrobiales bacterium]
MGVPSAVTGDHQSFLDFYDDALPHVYGYLARRCGPQAVVEDLTAETFLAAVDAARRPGAPAVSVPWVIGVARHKLVDHWRGQARGERRLAALADEEPSLADPWDAELDAMRVGAVLNGLAAQHRAALTLRYLDALSVTEVAAPLSRTVHAPEALLVRARRAFRRAYLDEDDQDA